MTWAYVGYRGNRRLSADSRTSDFFLHQHTGGQPQIAQHPPEGVSAEEPECCLYSATKTRALPASVGPTCPSTKFVKTSASTRHFGAMALQF